jgi:cell division protein FtsQ
MSTRAPVSSRSSAPTAPPRTRTRTKATAVRRRRLVVLGIILVVLLALAYGVTRSPLLAIDSVQVRGTSHLTKTQVLDAAGVHDGDAMVWLDTGAAVDGMNALPYVRGATLTRAWPHTVRIMVHERVPSAWVQTPSGIALVDGTGRVVEDVDAAPPSMPQLLGAKVVPPPGGTVDAVGAARVAGALTGLAAVGTASVEHTDHGVVVHLASGPEIRMGEATQIEAKVSAGFAVLASCDGKPVVYVDVSVVSNPVASGC